jgi:hypothetical protein
VWCWAWNVHDTWTATYPCWTSTPLGFSNINHRHIDSTRQEGWAAQRAEVIFSSWNLA